MSKILKRTLTLALIFCMLLSVMAPLASAAEPTTVTYDFKKTGSKTANTLYTAANSPIKGTNWYYLKGTANETKTDASNGLWNVTANNSHWQAVMINVPAEGDYCVTAELTSGNTAWADNGGIFIAKADAMYNDSYDNLERVNRMKSTWSFSGVANYSIKAYANFRVTYQLLKSGSVFSMNAYLGNTHMEAGEYIVLIQQSASTGNTGNMALRTLTLTPSTDATPFVNMITADDNFNRSKHFFMCEDVVAESAALYLSGAVVHTNGKKLTVNSVTARQAMNDGTTYVGLQDLVGTTTVKTMNGKAPVMPATVNGGLVKKVLPLYNETIGAYEFVAPTTQFEMKQGVSNPIVNAEEGAAKFVFKVTLPEDAYAKALSEKSTLKVTADWTLNGEEQDTVYFDEFMAPWVEASAEDEQVFYVTLTGFDKLTEETEITVTPKISVLTNTITLDTILYTYTPAAA